MTDMLAKRIQPMVFQARRLYVVEADGHNYLMAQDDVRMAAA